MPAQGPLRPFPGMSSLPEWAQGLFPQTHDMPVPVMSAIGGAVPGALRAAAKAQPAAQDMLNPYAQRMMQRMGDQVRGMGLGRTQRVPSTARATADVGASLPPSTHPKGMALDALDKATKRASARRAGQLPALLDPNASIRTALKEQVYGAY